MKEKLAEAQNDKDINLPLTATDASGSVTPSHDQEEEHALKQSETLRDPNVKEANEKEWHLVGSQKASPKRVLQQSNDNSKTTGSPSRFHLLSEVEEDEVEEGEVEASSTEEEEPYSLETNIPKEDPKVESKQQKGTTVNKDRNRGRVERQEEHQANKKKKKCLLTEALMG